MAKTINSDLIRGNINTIILKALFEGDRYGYEIIREIEDRSHGQYILKQPTLYSCLKRLENQGFVSSYWGEESNGGRRKYYSLTDMGKEVFVQNQDEYEFSRTIIDQLISDKAYDFSELEHKTMTDNEDYTFNEDEELDIGNDDFSTDSAETSSRDSLSEQTASDDNLSESVTAQTDEDLFDEESTSDENFFDFRCDDCDDIDATEVEASEVSNNEDDFSEFSEEKTNHEADIDTQDAITEEQNKQNTTSGFDEFSRAPEETSTPSMTSQSTDCASTISDTPTANDLFETMMSKNAQNETSYFSSLEKIDEVQSAGNDGIVYSSSDSSIINLYHQDYGFVFDETDEESATTLNDESVSPPLTQKHSFERIYTREFEQEKTTASSDTDETKIKESESTFTPYSTPVQSEKQSTDYKSSLSKLLDGFSSKTESVREKELEKKSEHRAQSQKEQIQTRNFGKLTESIRELGDSVTIRTPDNKAARDYQKQYYVLINKLRLVQYGILFVVMLLETFLTFIITKATTGITMPYHTPLYVIAILFCLAFPVAAALMYYRNPNKQRRVDDFNLKNSMIIRIIIMLQLALITYALNIYFAMPIGGSPEYAVSLFIPIVLSTNVPLSAILFNLLKSTTKFSA